MTLPHAEFVELEDLYEQIAQGEIEVENTQRILELERKNA